MKVALAAGALVVLALTACSSGDDEGAASSTSTSPSSASASARPATTVADQGAAATTADVDFRNFTYDLSSVGDGTEGDPAVTVSDGSFTRTNPEDQLYFEVVDVDLADLDGDGQSEAAVTIHYSTGGTGQFTDVLIYRLRDGMPQLVTSDGIGDRADGGLVSVGVGSVSGAGHDTIVVRRNAGGEGACCPTAVEQRSLQLDGDRLVTVGTTETWAVVLLGAGGESTDAPTEITFLPGTNRATVQGDATEPVTATFDATANQQVEITLDSAEVEEAPISVKVTGPDGAKVLTVGRDTAAGYAATTLPSTGTYEMAVSPVGEVDPDVGRFFEFDVTIG